MYISTVLYFYECKNIYESSILTPTNVISYAGLQILDDDVAQKLKFTSFKTISVIFYTEQPNSNLCASSPCTCRSQTNKR